MGGAVRLSRLLFAVVDPLLDDLLRVRRVLDVRRDLRRLLARGQEEEQHARRVRARQLGDRRRRGGAWSDRGGPTRRGKEQPRRAGRKRAQQSNEPGPEHRRDYTFSSASGYTVRPRGNVAA